ncbi:MAG TPA: DNA starvation/stationary phase protection protein [Chitinophagaceae bacterium]|jgi:starvation-inducible DNA-binding protein|nr:DNA starvation/stationary phase protection protein [Chitinophagaceae bacterium]
MTPNLGISAKNLKSITGLLSAVLADAMILYTKTRKFHWNVSGNSFMELHKLFEKQYTQLEEAIDEIAERINKLGAKTPGTLEEFLKMGSIKEAPGKYPSQKEMLNELLNDHEAVVRQLRKHIKDCDEKYDDIGTSDFLTDMIKEHETIAWTLRRYLQ